VTSSVVFVLVGFLALFAFFDVINELDDVGKGGYSIQIALLSIALEIPTRAYELLPIAVLIGAIYALAQFAQHSEFTAMRAAGLSRTRALREIASVGVVFAVITLLVGEVVAPQAEKLVRQLRMQALGTTVVGQFRSGIWVRDTLRDPQGQPVVQRFINIREIESDGGLRGLQVFEFDQSFRLERIIEAQQARYLRSTGWRLFGVSTIAVDPSSAGIAGEPVRPQSDQTRPTTPLAAKRTEVGEQAWDTGLTPDIFNVALVAPEKMSALNLWQYVRHLRDNQQASDRYELALWKKMLYPLATVVMMALALPFAYLQVRAGGIGYKVFVGIMLGVSFHLLNGLFSHLGLLNTWPSWISAGFPSFLAMAVALAMLAWVDRVR
jgi:lipopolysaccharide export system permease protein